MARRAAGKVIGEREREESLQHNASHESQFICTKTQAHSSQGPMHIRSKPVHTYELVIHTHVITDQSRAQKECNKYSTVVVEIIFTLSIRVTAESN